MNTKTDGISSGLVAVAWREKTGYARPFWMYTEFLPFAQNTRDCEALVRLSDAEAIIAKLSSKDRYGVRDECGTPYSFDPTDGGTICVKCQKDKIAQTDAEILEQCRINGIGAERELHLLAQVAAKDAEIRALKQRPAHELREMLRSMQEGEMTVSRGIELVEMWLAGNYSDDQLPPVNNDLTEDQWPMEELRKARTEIERLNRENEDLITLNDPEYKKQAERIKELESDVDEEAHIRDRMAKLLAETAVALKGPEKALHRHGWQDLPDVAAKQSAALKLAREALETCDVGDCSTGHVIDPSFDAVAVDEALAAIDALKGE